ncbi:hypothetical protein J6590_040424 [Homalodisca vitripennis]|nr:hypothetical protein J6590_040424 [Homalodisca vitripennis]
MASSVDSSELCPNCNIKVDDDEKALQCEGFCQKWHHASCVDIGDKEYFQIGELKCVHWFCVLCYGGLAKDNIDVNNKLDHVVSQNERLGDQIVNPKQKQSLVKAVTIDLEQPTDRLVTVNEDINLNVTNGSNESYQDMDISRHRPSSTSKSLDNVCEAKRPTYSSVVASKSSALNINTFKPTKKQVRQTAAPLIGTKARASEGDNNLKTVVRYPTERKSWVFVSRFTP